jgi:hypothetical protein
MVVREGDIIFLSASVPYREEWIGDSRPAEIEEAIVSIARAVFARGGRLLFGGHPSVSPLVSAVAGEYFRAEPTREVRPVVTFQSRLYEGLLPDKTTEMVRMGWSAIEWTPRAKGKNPDQTKELSLGVMRDQMLPTFDGASGPDQPFIRNKLRPPLAMIAVGGIEGIRDEAIVFLRKRQMWEPRQSRRVYSFKSGGGASARLVEPDVQGLWPKPKDRPDDEALKTLREAKAAGDIVDVEAEWHHKFPIKTDAPFQPYAAMAQWLLDTQLGLVS